MSTWEDTINFITTAGSKLGSGLEAAGTVAGSNWFQNLAGLASTGYDIYQGIQKQQASQRMYDLMYGTAANQDIWANLVKARYVDTYWPYETTQYGYAVADQTAMRESDVAARDYNIARKYQQIQQAGSINPVLDSAEMSLINTLVASVDNLRTRLANDAIVGVNQSFDNTRAQDLRRLGTLGVNPSSGARLTYSRALASSQALASAAARNNAAMIAEDTSISRQGQALAYRAGVNLPTYQTTPSVQAGNVTTALTSVGGMAATAGSQLDNSAQQSFTGAATALNSMYMLPITEKYMSAATARMGR